MQLLSKKLTFSLAVLLLAACWLLPASVFPLPKDQKTPVPPDTGAPGKFGPPVPHRQMPVIPVAVGWDRNPVNWSPGEIGYRSPAPNVIGQMTVPFIDVQTGTVEFPYTNNYLRDLSVHLVGGCAQVHMVYPIFTGFTRADSFHNKIPLYYNSYNCGCSGSLDHHAPGMPMSYSPPPLDVRQRALGWGGGVVNFTAAGQSTVVYGNRYIQRTDLGPYIWSFRGPGLIRDAAECLGAFSTSSVDTSMGVNTPLPFFDPVVRAINESVWVATYAVEDFNQVYFNFSTDRGQTWSSPIVSPMKTSWYNAVNIATNGGNVFYLTGMSNPALPTTFWVSERPCYVKGTYNPASGTISLGPMIDVTGDFELPCFLPIPHQLQSVLVGTTLHLVWTDWNDYMGQAFPALPGPGGHVHHVAVNPDGTSSPVHKIANINIDGRLPDRSATLFGFALGPWGSGLGLSYNQATTTLYATWSQPREEYDANGVPTFQWDDPWMGKLANFDIYCSASNSGGNSWDNPVNFTDTKNAGCSGTAADPCAHEDYFAAFPDVVDDTVWVMSILRPKPGFRLVAREAGISPDPGSEEMLANKIRLYKVPARPVAPGVRPDLFVKAPDTTDLCKIVIPPRGSHTVNMRLANIGTAGFFLDSLVIDPSLDEGVGNDLLDVTNTAVPGGFIGLGGSYDFTITLDASRIPVRAGGTRCGLIRAYGHNPGVAPPNDKGVAIIGACVTVTVCHCLNRQVRIHSATNVTDVGTQGSIADEAGTAGLQYNTGTSIQSNRFYDGGVWIANSELNAGDCGGGPRKITRQIFGDDFLRCIADGELGSVPIGGGNENLFVRSIGTDVGDSSLIWLNLWEQSTHPDSSDWLVQNVRVVNASENRIDSVALGVLYDIDIYSNISLPAHNVGGDAIVTGADGRSYHLGWIGGNDVAVDTCSPNAQLYGFIVIPDPLNPPPIPGPTIEPRLAVVYRQTAFSYNLDCAGSGGDALAQRWSWGVTGFHSTTNRILDPNRGDDSLIYEYNENHAGADTCLDGRLWRADMGYMAIAKKVYNFPVNIGVREAVARYGLASLATGVDTFFRGSGESYSVIHIGSITGLTGLINNAEKAVKWFWNHAGQHLGSSPLTGLRGDMNASRSLSGADVVSAINYIFNDADSPFGALVPKCVPDVNGDDALSGADIVTLINGVFNAPGGVNPSAVCPLCLTSCCE